MKFFNNPNSEEYVVSPAPSEDDLVQYLIDRIISDMRIFDKIVHMQNVREGNFYIKDGFAYIGATDESSAETIDFNLRI